MHNSDPRHDSVQRVRHPMPGKAPQDAAVKMHRFYLDGKKWTRARSTHGCIRGVCKITECFRSNFSRAFSWSMQLVEKNPVSQRPKIAGRLPGQSFVSTEEACWAEIKSFSSSLANSFFSCEIPARRRRPEAVAQAMEEALNKWLLRG